jgi:hypothetical protein
MRELTITEVQDVNGGIDQGTQIGSQIGLMGIGTALAIGGFALTPIGAVMFIGTSLSLTASYIYYNSK